MRIPVLLLPMEKIQRYHSLAFSSANFSRLKRRCRHRPVAGLRVRRLQPQVSTNMELTLIRDLPSVRSSGEHSWKNFARVTSGPNSMEVGSLPSGS